MNVEPIRIADIESDLPTLLPGECWRIRSTYLPPLTLSRSACLEFRVSIVGDDGFYPQSIWERLRDVPKIARQKVLCSAEKRVIPEHVSMAADARREVLKLVGSVYATRKSQLVIEGFTGEVCS